MFHSLWIRNLIILNPNQLTKMPTLCTPSSKENETNSCMQSTVSLIIQSEPADSSHSGDWVNACSFSLLLHSHRYWTFSFAVFDVFINREWKIDLFIVAVATDNVIQHIFIYLVYVLFALVIFSPRSYGRKN